MKTKVILVAALCLVLSSVGYSQQKDAKQKKEDVPDVALKIPEDTRPEVKAIIKDNEDPNFT